MNKISSNIQMVRISVKKEGVSFTGGVYPLNRAITVTNNLVRDGFKIISVKAI